jgi:hypothetical protein
MKSRIVICLFFGGLPSFVSAQIEGFDESFSGVGVNTSIGGTYEGLDNPGWGIGDFGVVGSADVAITPDGLSVFADSEPIGGLIAGQQIARFVYGQGSFHQQIDLANFSLGNSPYSEDGFGSTTYAGLSHQFAPGEVFPRVSVSLGEGPNTEGEDWLFAFSVRNSDGGSAHREFVPRGSDVSLALSYDSASNEFTGSYDVDTLDPTNELIEVSLPRNFDFPEISETRFTLEAEGQIALSATISRWKLTPVSEILGDLNGNATLDLADLELLIEAFRSGDFAGDVSGDGQIDFDDVGTWVNDLKGTYFGDVNLDGEFDSADLVNVFTAGEYEDAIAGNSRWSTGDWNADFDFSTGDLVFAFQEGGYDQGPRASVSSVPEPSTALLMAFAAMLIVPRTRRRWF